MKHSKRTIAGAQATKSQRQRRRLREGTGEASKAPTPTETPETPEATTEAPRSGFTAWDMEERKRVLDRKTHPEVLDLADCLRKTAVFLRVKGCETQAAKIEQELEVIHEYVRAFILPTLPPRGAGAPGSPVFISRRDLH